MHQELVDRYLCCPVDGEYPLAIDEAEWSGLEIVSGLLRCPVCATAYPVVGGMPFMLLPSAYQESEVAAAKEREARARDADADKYDQTIPEYETALEGEALFDAAQLRSNDIIANLGAGTGRNTLKMAATGATILEIDLSPRSLEINRMRCKDVSQGSVHHIVADACCLPLRAGIATKALSAMMLEHIPTAEERQRCLDEVFRVLKPGGRVAVTTYNYSWSKRRRGSREGFHAGTLYYYRMTHDQLAKLIPKFAIRKLTGIINLPPEWRLQMIDRFISRIPLLARNMGKLLLVEAERKSIGSVFAIVLSIAGINYQAF